MTKSFFGKVPRPAFFASSAHPGWQMTKFGEVYLDDLPEDSPGTCVKLEIADEPLQDQVQREARKAGYMQYLSGQWELPVELRPKKESSNGT